MMLSAASRWTTQVACLLGVMAMIRTASGQMIAPAGVRISSAVIAPCKACSEHALGSTNYDSEDAFTLGHSSRRAHILIGFVAGVTIGVAIGSIVANRDAKRCHTESCQGPFQGLNEMIKGGVYGVLLGTLVGAVWPVRN